MRLSKNEAEAFKKLMYIRDNDILYSVNFLIFDFENKTLHYCHNSRSFVHRAIRAFYLENKEIEYNSFYKPLHINILFKLNLYPTLTQISPFIENLYSYDQPEIKREGTIKVKNMGLVFYEYFMLGGGKYVTI